MDTVIYFIGEFFFGFDGAHVAPQIIKPAFRFSIWRDKQFPTAGELQELVGQDVMNPGETAKVRIMMMNGKIAQSLKVGDVLYWGAPSLPVGTVKVLEFLSPEQKT